jgi:post-segregation antitoxin (ccd killing protein)
MSKRDETPAPVEVELPQWLWEAACEKGIDLSALLEKALKADLGVDEADE